MVWVGGGGGGGNNCGVLQMQLNKQIDAVCRMRRLVRAMVPLILLLVMRTAVLGAGKGGLASLCSRL